LLYFLFLFLQDFDSRLDKLRLHMSEIKEQLNTHSSEYNRKSTQHDAKFKLLTQQTETLDDFDLNNFQENIKSINTDIDMHNKLQITMEKSLNDLILSVKPSYASMALEAPDDLNVN
jgi:chromosome segregation ATPase